MTLWKTDSAINKDLQQLVEEFTVGNDYILDQALVPFDVDASIAHAEGLASINILNASELTSLISTLKEIKDLHAKDQFPISPAQEDGHTAIEDYLVSKIGDTGKKIHAGRSRNDQVLVAMRLWEREKIDQTIYSTQYLAKLFHKFS